MTDVVIPLVGDFVQDVCEITVEGCITAAKASALEAGEAAAADEVTTEFNSIGD
jgi:hypothetical protein